MSKYGVFSGPHFPVFGLNVEKYGPENLRIWTIFTQWSYIESDKIGIISVYRLITSSKPTVTYFLQFPKSCDKFLNIQDCLAPILFIFYIYSTGYSSIRANKTMPPFFFNTHCRYYNHKMTLLL